jgi:hypothetical protein
MGDFYEDVLKPIIDAAAEAVSGGWKVIDIMDPGTSYSPYTKRFQEKMRASHIKLQGVNTSEHIEVKVVGTVEIIEGLTAVPGTLKEYNEVFHVTPAQFPITVFFDAYRKRYKVGRYEDIQVKKILAREIPRV